MSQNRFLQLEDTLKEKGQLMDTGRVSLARSGGVITAEELRQLIESAGTPDSPKAIIDLIVKFHSNHPNASISGETLNAVFGAEAPTEVKAVLKGITKIEKKGQKITVQLNKSSVQFSAGGQNITLSNPVTANVTTINSNEIVIELSGVSVWAGKVKKAFITPQKVSVKVGILPAITVWEPKSGAQSRVLNYMRGMHTMLSLSLGEQIVKNYNDSNDKQPGGDCFAVAKSRVLTAYSQVHGSSLLDNLPASPVNGLSSKKFFSLLWNDWYWHNKWLQAPQEYRAKGSAGAVVWAGIATAVDHNQVLSGDLQPGAVIQTWGSQAQFTHLRDNHNSMLDGTIGHSFIFLNYHYDKGNITGMYIADQGTGWDGATPMSINTWGHYSGANFN